MTGESTWLDLTGPFLVLLTLFALSWLWRVRQRLHAVLMHFTCPTLKQSVDCTLVRDARSGKWTAVDRCSGLIRGATCDEACRQALNGGNTL